MIKFIKYIYFYMNKKGLEIPLANGFDDVTMVVFDGPARKQQ